MCQGRAKAQCKVTVKTNAYLHKMLNEIKEIFQAMVKDKAGAKTPVILMGRGGDEGHGVRGTRGNFAKKLRKFLAQHFVVITVDENNTTKLCPRCNHEAELPIQSGQFEPRYARTAQQLSRARTAPDREMPFCYDRDCGAPIKQPVRRGPVLGHVG